LAVLRYKYVRSIVLDSSISCYGPVILQCMILSSLTLTTAHIYSRALVVGLTVHVCKPILVGNNGYLIVPIIIIIIIIIDSFSSETDF
jgi:hypothetical protein